MPVDPSPPPVRAIALAGRWQRLVQNHLPLRGGPCACLIGVGSIAIADVELDIMDFLHGKFAADGVLDRHFAQAGYRPGASGGVVPLLRAIAQDPAPPTQALALLDGLENSLRSLEAGH